MDGVKLPLGGSERISMSAGFTGYFSGKGIRPEVGDITLIKYIYIMK